MEYNSAVSAAPQGRQIEINKVLRNTYALLAMTFVWSAVICGFAMMADAPRIPWWGMLIGFYGLLFAVEKTKDSAMGLFFVFALTGFMGFTLGPVISMFAGAGAMDIVLFALAGTGLTFFGLSAYVLVTKKDMSFLSGAITALFIVLIIGMIANIFLNIPALSLAMSALFIVFSSMAILYQTSAIIHGGETNYISATVTLFVSLYNIFVSLLSILMSFSSDD
ncbi:MAG: Bax inhibitor-1/YccA family protein [Pseudomonadota bacterium]